MSISKIARKFGTKEECLTALGQLRADQPMSILYSTDTNQKLNRVPPTITGFQRHVDVYIHLRRSGVNIEKFLLIHQVELTIAFFPAPKVRVRVTFHPQQTFADINAFCQTFLTKGLRLPNAPLTFFGQSVSSQTVIPPTRTATVESLGTAYSVILFATAPPAVPQRGPTPQAAAQTGLTVLMVESHKVFKENRTLIPSGVGTTVAQILRHVTPKGSRDKYELYVIASNKLGIEVQRPDTSVSALVPRELHIQKVGTGCLIVTVTSLNPLTPPGFVGRMDLPRGQTTLDSTFNDLVRTFLGQTVKNVVAYDKMGRTVTKPAKIHPDGYVCA
jgi:hypothetical protein